MKDSQPDFPPVPILRPKPEERLRAINQGNDLLSQFDQTGDSALLERAIVLLEWATADSGFAQIDLDLRLSTLNDVGTALLRRFDIGGPPEDLSKGVLLLREAAGLAEPGSEWLASSLSNLGLGLYNRYEETGEEADLDDAIATYRRINDEEFLKGAVDQALVSFNLGNFLHSKARKSDPSALAEAIEAYSRSLDLTPGRSPLRAARISGLGTALRALFERTGRRDDIDRCIWLQEEALAAAKAAHNTRIEFDIRQCLGNGLVTRYNVYGEPIDLTRALEQDRWAVDHTEQHSRSRRACLISLGNATFALYERSGQLDDLDGAIRYLEEGVALMDPTQEEYGPSAASLGSALYERFDRHGDMTDLDRDTTDLDRDTTDLDVAIKYLQKAVDHESPGTPYRAAFQSHLAFSLLSRCLASKKGGAEEEEYLSRAATSIGEAVDASDEDSIVRPMLLANLGLFHRVTYQDSKDLAVLRKALACYDEAISELSPEAAIRPAVCLSFANTLRDVYRDAPEESTLAQGIEQYRESIGSGRTAAPRVVLKASRDWGSWATSRRSFAEAAEAYDYGLTAMEQLFRTQLTRGHKETWLRDARGLPVRAAYARAMAEDPQGAVEAIEGGRALLLSEALERDRADLDRLVGAGRADLKERYEAAAGRWNQLSARGDTAIAEPEVPGAPTITGRSLTEELRRAKEDLDASVDEIRGVPGYERFLLPPTFSDVVADAGDDPLVYLGATEAGGLALIVRPTEAAVEVVWLPDLTEEALAKRVLSYRDAFEAYRDGPRTTEDRIPWESTIDQVTAWTWDTAMAPVLEGLGKTPRVTLVPAGLLGALPLHAAWTPDTSTPTGRRYALDLLTPTYAPNARALAAARKVWEEVQGEHLVAVDEPDLGTDEPRLRLPLSSLEVEAATSVFPDHEVLAGQDASETEVLGALARAQVFHLSCHGRADPARPLEAALTMAGGEPLSLGDILDRRLRTRIGVLSACETAIPGQELPDEVVALPTGLIQAGVGAAVASLWSVPGLATAMLMVRFYERWRVMGIAPADALREAQCWVRDSTTSEKTEYLEALLPETGHRMASAGTEKLYRALALDPDLDPDSRDHEDPYHWAAFTYVGA